MRRRRRSGYPEQGPVLLFLLSRVTPLTPRLPPCVGLLGSQHFHATDRRAVCARVEGEAGLRGRLEAAATADVGDALVRQRAANSVRVVKCHQEGEAGVAPG